MKIVPRDIPLVPNRVASVFKQKQTTVASSEQSSEDDGETQVIEKAREVSEGTEHEFKKSGKSKNPKPCSVFGKGGHGVLLEILQSRMSTLKCKQFGSDIGTTVKLDWQFCFACRMYR